MYKPTFGTRGQIRFSCPEEYYMLLGYLAKSDGSTSIVWEHNENQGAWGSEGRIQFHTDFMPFSANLTYTAGNGGNVIHRVNCNEFIENINCNHNFVMGNTQNYGDIKSTVPLQYTADFDMGFSL